MTVLLCGSLQTHLGTSMPSGGGHIIKAGLGGSVADDEISGLAARLAGRSMAAVDALIREAKTIARTKGRPLQGGDLAAFLPPQATAAQRWRIALHEAGHALVATALRQGTIKRITMANGGGLTERSMAEFSGVAEEFDALLAIHMAGRAAEAVILGNIGAGSGGSPDSDLGQATRIALSLETELGLGGLGPIWLEGATLIDRDLQQRVRHRIQVAEARARDIVAAEKANLIGIAEALMREEDLSGPRLAELLYPVSVWRNRVGDQPVPAQTDTTGSDKEVRPVPDNEAMEVDNLILGVEGGSLGEEIVSA